MIDYGIIIQARMGSTRRPGKINYMFNDKPLLYHQISRLLCNGFSNKEIFVATTLEKNDDITEEICNDIGIKVYRGDTDDVLKRYINCAERYGVKNIIRVGGDDPLIDPECIKELIHTHKNNPVDFVYASHKFGWIYGTAAELVKLSSLKKAQCEAKDKSSKEHVVTFIRKNPNFSKIKVVPANKCEIRPDILLSVDYEEDLKVVESLLNHFYKIGNLYSFSQIDMIKIYDEMDLNGLNSHLHEGFEID